MAAMPTTNTTNTRTKMGSMSWVSSKPCANCPARAARRRLALGGCCRSPPRGRPRPAPSQEVPRPTQRAHRLPPQTPRRAAAGRPSLSLPRALDPSATKPKQSIPTLPFPREASRSHQTATGQTCTAAALYSMFCSGSVSPSPEGTRNLAPLPLPSLQDLSQSTCTQAVSTDITRNM